MNSVFASQKVFIQEFVQGPSSFMSLANGVTCVHYGSEGKSWGQVSWYDMIAGYLRTLEIEKAPHIAGEHFEFEAKGIKYVFDPAGPTTLERIGKIVPDLIPSLGALKNEAEVQTFLKAKALE